MENKDKSLKTQSNTDSKVISTIDVHWISPQEQFLIEQNTCPLCGTELFFTHKADYVTHWVKEMAHCPHCNIQTRTTDNSLQ